MAKTFVLMEEPMQAPSGDQRITPPSSRVRELGLVLPAPPTPLGAYVESSDAFSSVAFFLLSMGNSPFPAGWATIYRLSKARKRLSSPRLTPSPSRRNISATWIG